MDLDLLWRGMLIGLAVAAPVGPIGVLCIRRTLHDGRLVGFVSGLGAASADAAYGAIAGLGLAALTAWLVELSPWLRLFGGLFLLYLGLDAWRSPPASSAAAAPNGRGLWWAYLSTLLLTITNPLTILSFLAIFAGLGLAELGGDYRAALILTAGVWLGSALWWLSLSGAVGLFRERIGPRTMGWINRGAGAIIIAAGLLALFGR